MTLATDKFQNMIRAKVIEVLSTFTHLRVGIITSYDPKTYKAKVQLQPDNSITGYLPVLANWSGDGWGMYAPPSLNDLVIVHYMEGDLSCGFIGERIFNSVEKPITTPTGVPSGELWMVHKTGSFFKLHNDGSIEMKAVNSSGGEANLNIDANLVVTGTIKSTGDILDNSATNHNTLALMRSIYNVHTHGGVSAGGALTLATTENQ